MVDTDPVRVTVEIADQFSDDIERMRKQLKSLERKLSVSLDIDDNGDIDWAKASIESIEDIIDVLVKVKDGDVDKLIAKLEAVDGKKTSSTHTIEERKDRRKSAGWNPLPQGGGWFQGDDDFSADWAKGIANHMDFEGISGKVNASVPTEALGDKEGLFTGFIKEHGPDNILKDSKGKSPFASFKNILRPSMNKWFKLLAAIMPMMVALIGATMGLVAALSAVGIAAYAAFALGKWGLDDAQARLQEFKRELKGVFAPASQSFAPLLMEFLQRAPGMLERSGLVQALTKLTYFEGLFYEIFGGAANWLAKAMSSMADFEPVISKILKTFGSAVGGSLLNLMKWLVLETARNREQFMRLAKVFGDIIAIVYNVSKAVAFAIAFFEPLFGIVAKVSNLLNNRFAVAMLVAIGIAVALASVLSTVVGILGTGLVASIMAALGPIATLIAEMATLLGVSQAVAAALAATGIGIFAVAGGIAAYQTMKPDTSVPQGTSAGSISTGVGAGGGGGGPVMNVNIEGNAGRDELNRMNDMMDRKWKTYSGREESRSK